MLSFRVIPGDPLPIYRQIVRQIEDGIAGGKLGPGDRLPSHRELAAVLVIAPLTVKKAYDELSRRGAIRMVQGQGTFVVDRPTPLSENEKMERIRPTVRRLVSEAYLTGVGLKQLVAALRHEHQAMRKERGGATGKEKKKK